MAAREASGINGWWVIAPLALVVVAFAVYQYVTTPTGADVDRAKTLATSICGYQQQCYARSVARIGEHRYQVLVWRVNGVAACYSTNTRTDDVREVAPSDCRAAP